MSPQQLELLEFGIGSIISTLLLIVTTLINYEILRLLRQFLLTTDGRPHMRIAGAMLLIFTSHVIAIWLYGITFWLLDTYADIGSLKGDLHEGFLQYIYYSSTSYTSLGFGDITPTGGLQLITGAEVLNGLLLIGWSITFTFVVMEKLWELHPRRR